MPPSQLKTYEVENTTVFTSFIQQLQHNGYLGTHAPDISALLLWVQGLFMDYSLLWSQVWSALLWAGWSLGFSGKLSSHVTLNLSWCSKMAMDGITSCTADTGSSGMSWLLCQSQLSSSGTGATGLLLGFQGSCPVNDCSHSKSVWGQRALFSHHYDRIPGRNTPSREGLLWLMTSKGSPSWRESMPKHGRSVWLMLCKW